MACSVLHIKRLVNVMKFCNIYVFYWITTAESRGDLTGCVSICHTYLYTVSLFCLYSLSLCMIMHWLSPLPSRYTQSLWEENSHAHATLLFTRFKWKAITIVHVMHFLLLVYFAICPSVPLIHCFSFVLEIVVVFVRLWEHSIANNFWQSQSLINRRDGGSCHPAQSW